MEHLDLLYDHYKESFDLSKKAQSDRDKFFLFLIGLITVMFLFTIEPTDTITVFNSLIKENFKVDFSFNIYIIQTFLWFMLLYFSMRYYQKVIYIERQYEYLNGLEKVMSTNINPVFNREGQNYLNNYPLFGDFIDAIYKHVFPILYIIIVITKIGVEWLEYSNIFNILLNSILALLIIIMTVLYYIFLHHKTK